MNDYPKFTWDEYPPDDPERFNRQLEKWFGCVVAYYPEPPMSFKRFKEIWGKDRSIMSIDEPTRLRPKVLGSINPDSAYWFSTLVNLKDNG